MTFEATVQVLEGDPIHCGVDAEWIMTGEPYSLITVGAPLRPVQLPVCREHTQRVTICSHCREPVIRVAFEVGAVEYVHLDRVLTEPDAGPEWCRLTVATPAQIPQAQILGAVKGAETHLDLDPPHRLVVRENGHVLLHLPACLVDDELVCPLQDAIEATGHTVIPARVGPYFAHLEGDAIVIVVSPHEHEVTSDSGPILRDGPTDALGEATA